MASTTRNPSALVLIASGSEEMETVITVDILRRGGVNVVLAGLKGSEEIVCSRNVKIVPDVGLPSLTNKTEYDAIVLPGGMGGAEAFSQSKELHSLLNHYHSAPEKTVAVICASPIALHAAGVGLGKKITSHPSVKDRLAGDYDYREDRVVVDGNLITSRGPGTAFEFALALVKRLQGASKVAEIVPPMICNDEIIATIKK